MVLDIDARVDNDVAGDTDVVKSVSKVNIILEDSASDVCVGSTAVPFEVNIMLEDSAPDVCVEAILLPLEVDTCILITVLEYEARAENDPSHVEVETIVSSVDARLVDVVTTAVEDISSELGPIDREVSVLLIELVADPEETNSRLEDCSTDTVPVSKASVDNDRNHVGVEVSDSKVFTDADIAELVAISTEISVLLAMLVTNVAAVD